MTTNGTVRASAALVTPNTGTPWQLVGVGDMNNDGDSDLLWQSSTSRIVAIWLMADNVRSSAVVATPTIADPNFNVNAPR